MRVAALYDIHGKRPALEAVLGELREEPVEEHMLELFAGAEIR